MTLDDINCIDTSLLPTQMRLLIKAIGLAETIELLKARGGQLLRIPTTGTRETGLDSILKRDSVLALCNSTLAGHRIDLPKPDKVLTQLRNMQILAQRGQRTKRELSREYNLTERMIQLIWNGEPETDPTMDMFG